MGWWPQSVWIPEITEVADFNPSPHIFMETMISMAMAANSSENLKVGSCVTEVVRRHPAMLAQSILTVDHVSHGRAILGIGAGEAENIIPYGLDFSKPVSKLEEALEIINILWKSEAGETIDYDGNFWQVEDAVFDLPLYDGKAPPIWLGAHGPRMLELTAEHGDGWLPSTAGIGTPEEYEEKLSQIKSMAKKKGRDPSEITPGLLTRIIIGEDKEECLEIMDTKIVKARCLALPTEFFEEDGFSHPLAEGSYDFVQEYIPSKLSKKEALKAIDSIPQKVVKKGYLWGSVSDIIDQIDEYKKRGLKHIILGNETYFGGIDKLSSSYRRLEKVRDYFER